MKCLYPGTFDPITNGHLDVIKRALRLFDGVVVAIATNENKSPFFSISKRKKLVDIATKGLCGVEVVVFDNLLVDLARNLGINTVVRGLRAVSDFEYELQLNYSNNALWRDFESIFLMPSLENAFISSSIVRSIAQHGGDVSALVPREIVPFVKEIASKKCM